jgi:hypothetical protein
MTRLALIAWIEVKSELYFRILSRHLIEISLINRCTVSRDSKRGKRAEPVFVQHITRREPFDQGCCD